MQSTLNTAFVCTKPKKEGVGGSMLGRKQTEVLGDGISPVFNIAYKVHRAGAFATYAVKFSAFISTD